MIKDAKELNDVVCAAYKMGCDQTRSEYQGRIEKLESALREINGLYEGEEISDGVYARHRAAEMNDMIYKIVCDTLEGKDG